LLSPASDPENGPLSYARDLDDKGSFETPGQSVVFSASANSAPAAYTTSECKDINYAVLVGK